MPGGQAPAAQPLEAALTRSGRPNHRELWGGEAPWELELPEWWEEGMEEQRGRQPADLRVRHGPLARWLQRGSRWRAGAVASSGKHLEEAGLLLVSRAMGEVNERFQPEPLGRLPDHLPRSPWWPSRSKRHSFPFVLVCVVLNTTDRVIYTKRKCSGSQLWRR